ncbi:uncharacterized protein [Antedon mediterranea]|uniref:uncharacterized protein n=1 Tax=Antedon mediterranea TaxID=105859 RepID=UPI003AF4E4D4
MPTEVPKLEASTKSKVSDTVEPVTEGSALDVETDVPDEDSVFINTFKPTSVPIIEHKVTKESEIDTLTELAKEVVTTVNPVTPMQQPEEVRTTAAKLAEQKTTTVKPVAVDLTTETFDRTELLYVDDFASTAMPVSGKVFAENIISETKAPPFVELNINQTSPTISTKTATKEDIHKIITSMPTEVPKVEASTESKVSDTVEPVTEGSALDVETDVPDEDSLFINTFKPTSVSIVEQKVTKEPEIDTSTELAKEVVTTVNLVTLMQQPEEVQTTAPKLAEQKTKVPSITLRAVDLSTEKVDKTEQLLTVGDVVSTILPVSDKVLVEEIPETKTPVVELNINKTSPTIGTKTATKGDIYKIITSMPTEVPKVEASTKSKVSDTVEPVTEGSALDTETDVPDEDSVFISTFKPTSVPIVEKKVTKEPVIDTSTELAKEVVTTVNQVTPMQQPEEVRTTAAKLTAQKTEVPLTTLKPIAVDLTTETFHKTKLVTVEDIVSTALPVSDKVFVETDVPDVKKDSKLDEIEEITSTAKSFEFSQTTPEGINVPSTTSKSIAVDSTTVVSQKIDETPENIKLNTTSPVSANESVDETGSGTEMPTTTAAIVEDQTPNDIAQIVTIQPTVPIVVEASTKSKISDEMGSGEVETDTPDKETGFISTFKPTSIPTIEQKVTKESIQIIDSTKEHPKDAKSIKDDTISAKATTLILETVSQTEKPLELQPTTPHHVEVVDTEIQPVTPIQQPQDVQTTTAKSTETSDEFTVAQKVTEIASGELETDTPDKEPSFITTFKLTPTFEQKITKQPVKVIDFTKEHSKGDKALKEDAISAKGTTPTFDSYSTTIDVQVEKTAQPQDSISESIKEESKPIEHTTATIKETMTPLVEIIEGDGTKDLKLDEIKDITSTEKSLQISPTTPEVVEEIHDVTTMELVTPVHQPDEFQSTTSKHIDEGINVPSTTSKPIEVGSTTVVSLPVSANESVDETGSGTEMPLFESEMRTLKPSPIPNVELVKTVDSTTTAAIVEDQKPKDIAQFVTILPTEVPIVVEASTKSKISDEMGSGEVETVTPDKETRFISTFKPTSIPTIEQKATKESIQIIDSTKEHPKDAKSIKDDTISAKATTLILETVSQTEKPLELQPTTPHHVEVVDTEIQPVTPIQQPQDVQTTTAKSTETSDEFTVAQKVTEIASGELETDTPDKEPSFITTFKLTPTFEQKITKQPVKVIDFTKEHSKGDKALKEDAISAKVTTPTFDSYSTTVDVQVEKTAQPQDSISESIKEESKPIEHTTATIKETMTPLVEIIEGDGTKDLKLDEIKDITSTEKSLQISPTTPEVVEEIHDVTTMELVTPVHQPNEFQSTTSKHIDEGINVPSTTSKPIEVGSTTVVSLPVSANESVDETGSGTEMPLFESEMRTLKPSPIPNVELVKTVDSTTTAAIVEDQKPKDIAKFVTILPTEVPIVVEASTKSKISDEMGSGEVETVTPDKETGFISTFKPTSIPTIEQKVTKEPIQIIDSTKELPKDAKSIKDDTISAKATTPILETVSQTEKPLELQPTTPHHVEVVDTEIQPVTPIQRPEDVQITTAKSVEETSDKFTVAQRVTEIASGELETNAPDKEPSFISTFKSTSIPTVEQIITKEPVKVIDFTKEHSKGDKVTVPTFDSYSTKIDVQVEKTAQPQDSISESIKEESKPMEHTTATIKETMTPLVEIIEGEVTKDLKLGEIKDITSTEKSLEISPTTSEVVKEIHDVTAMQLVTPVYQPDEFQSTTSKHIDEGINVPSTTSKPIEVGSTTVVSLPGSADESVDETGSGTEMPLFESEMRTLKPSPIPNVELVKTVDSTTTAAIVEDQKPKDIAQFVTILPTEVPIVVEASTKSKISDEMGSGEVETVTPDKETRFISTFKPTSIPTIEQKVTKEPIQIIDSTKELPKDAKSIKDDTRSAKATTPILETVSQTEKPLELQPTTPHHVEVVDTEIQPVTPIQRPEDVQITTAKSVEETYDKFTVAQRVTEIASGELETDAPDKEPSFISTFKSTSIPTVEHIITKEPVKVIDFTKEHSKGDKVTVPTFDSYSTKIDVQVEKTAQPQDSISESIKEESKPMEHTTATVKETMTPLVKVIEGDLTKDSKLDEIKDITSTAKSLKFSPTTPKVVKEIHDVTTMQLVTPVYQPDEFQSTTSKHIDEGINVPSTTSKPIEVGSTTVVSLPGSADESVDETGSGTEMPLVESEMRTLKPSPIPNVELVETVDSTTTAAIVEDQTPKDPAQFVTILPTQVPIVVEASTKSKISDEMGSGEVETDTPDKETGFISTFKPTSIPTIEQKFTKESIQIIDSTKEHPKDAKSIKDDTISSKATTPILETVSQTEKPLELQSTTPHHVEVVDTEIQPVTPIQQPQDVQTTTAKSTETSDEFTVAQKVTEIASGELETDTPDKEPSFISTFKPTPTFEQKITKQPVKVIDFTKENSKGDKALKEDTISAKVTTPTIGSYSTTIDVQGEKTAQPQDSISESIKEESKQIEHTTATIKETIEIIEGEVTKDLKLGEIKDITSTAKSLKFSPTTPKVVKEIHDFTTMQLVTPVYQPDEFQSTTSKHIDEGINVPSTTSKPIEVGSTTVVSLPGSADESVDETGSGTEVPLVESEMRTLKPSPIPNVEFVETVDSTTTAAIVEDQTPKDIAQFVTILPTEVPIVVEASTKSKISDEMGSGEVETDTPDKETGFISTFKPTSIPTIEQKVTKESIQIIDSTKEHPKDAKSIKDDTISSKATTPILETVSQTEKPLELQPTTPHHVEVVDTEIQPVTPIQRPEDVQITTAKSVEETSDKFTVAQQVTEIASGELETGTPDKQPSFISTFKPTSIPTVEQIITKEPVKVIDFTKEHSTGDKALKEDAISARVTAPTFDSYSTKIDVQVEKSAQPQDSISESIKEEGKSMEDTTGTIKETMKKSTPLVEIIEGEVTKDSKLDEIKDITSTEKSLQISPTTPDVVEEIHDVTTMELVTPVHQPDEFQSTTSKHIDEGINVPSTTSKPIEVGSTTVVSLPVSADESVDETGSGTEMPLVESEMRTLKPSPIPNVELVKTVDSTTTAAIVEDQKPKDIAQFVTILPTEVPIVVEASTKSKISDEMGSGEVETVTPDKETGFISTFKQTSIPTIEQKVTKESIQIIDSTKELPKDAKSIKDDTISAKATTPILETVSQTEKPLELQPTTPHHLEVVDTEIQPVTPIQRPEDVQITTAKSVEETSDKFTVAQQVTEISSGELETDAPDKEPSFINTFKSTPTFEQKITKEPVKVIDFTKEHSKGDKALKEDAISAKVTTPTFDSFSTKIDVQEEKTARPQDSISESIKEESKPMEHTTATIKETMTPLVKIIEGDLTKDSKLDEIKDITSTAKSLKFSPTTPKVVKEIHDVTTMQLVTPVYQPDEFQSTTSKHIDEGINVPSTTSKPIEVGSTTVVSLPGSADESVDETGSGTEMPLVESEMRTLKPSPIPNVELVETVDSTTTAAIVEDQTPKDIAQFVTILPTEVPIVVEASTKSKISDEMGSGEVETDTPDKETGFISTFKPTSIPTIEQKVTKESIQIIDSTKEHPKDAKSIKDDTISAKATTPIHETVSQTEKPLELQPTTPHHAEVVDTEIQPVTPIQQPQDVQTTTAKSTETSDEFTVAQKETEIASGELETDTPDKEPSFISTFKPTPTFEQKITKLPVKVIDFTKEHSKGDKALKEDAISAKVTTPTFDSYSTKIDVQVEKTAQPQDSISESIKEESKSMEHTTGTIKETMTPLVEIIEGEGTKDLKLGEIKDITSTAKSLEFSPTTSEVVEEIHDVTAMQLVTPVHQPDEFQSTTSKHIDEGINVPSTTSKPIEVGSTTVASLPVSADESVDETGSGTDMPLVELEMRTLKPSPFPNVELVGTVDSTTTAVIVEDQTPNDIAQILTIQPTEVPIVVEASTKSKFSDEMGSGELETDTPDRETGLISTFKPTSIPTIEQKVTKESIQIIDSTKEHPKDDKSIKDDTISAKATTPILETVSQTEKPLELQSTTPHHVEVVDTEIQPVTPIQQPEDVQITTAKSVEKTSDKFTVAQQVTEIASGELKTDTPDKEPSFISTFKPTSIPTVEQIITKEPVKVIDFTKEHSKGDKALKEDAISAKVTTPTIGSYSTIDALGEKTAQPQDRISESIKEESKLIKYTTATIKETMTPLVEIIEGEVTKDSKLDEIKDITSTAKSLEFSPTTPEVVEEIHDVTTMQLVTPVHQPDEFQSTTSKHIDEGINVPSTTSKPIEVGSTTVASLPVSADESVDETGSGTDMPLVELEMRTLKPSPFPNVELVGTVDSTTTAVIVEDQTPNDIAQILTIQPTEVPIVVEASTKSKFSDEMGSGELETDTPDRETGLISTFKPTSIPTIEQKVTKESIQIIDSTKEHPKDDKSIKDDTISAKATTPILETVSQTEKPLELQSTTPHHVEVVDTEIQPVTPIQQPEDVQITTAKSVEKTSDKFTVAQQVTEIASGELETDAPDKEPSFISTFKPTSIPTVEQIITKEPVKVIDFTKEHSKGDKALKEDAISAKVTTPTIGSYSTIDALGEKTAQPQDRISESIKEESKLINYTTATIKETMTPLVEIIEGEVTKDSKLDEIKDITSTAKSLEFSPTTPEVVEEIHDVTTMQLVTPVHQPDEFQSTTSKHIDEGMNVPSTTSKPIEVGSTTVVLLPVSADESVDETGSGTDMPLVESEMRTLKPSPIPNVELVETVDLKTTAAIVEDQTPNDIAQILTIQPTEVPIVVEASTKSKISDEMGSGEVETDTPDKETGFISTFKPTSIPTIEQKVTKESIQIIDSTKEHPKDDKSIKDDTISSKATTPIHETVSQTEKPLELQPTTPHHVEVVDTEIQPVTLIQQPEDVQITTAKLVEKTSDKFTVAQQVTEIASGELETDTPDKEPSFISTFQPTPIPTVERIITKEPIKVIDFTKQHPKDDKAIKEDAISAKVTVPTFDSYSTKIDVQGEKSAQPQDSISESIKEESKPIEHTTATIKETMTPLVEIIEGEVTKDLKLGENKDITSTAKSLKLSPTTPKVVEEIYDVTTMQLVTPVHQPDKFQSTTSKHIDEGINVPSTSSKPIAVGSITVVPLPVSADESVDETGSGTEMPLVESEMRTLKPLPIPSVELVESVDSTTATIVEDQTPNDIAHFVTTLPTEVPIVVEASTKSKISDEKGSGEVETDTPDKETGFISTFKPTSIPTIEQKVTKESIQIIDSTKEHPKDDKSITDDTISAKATTPILETVSQTEKPIELQPTTPHHVEVVDTEIQPVTPIQQPEDVQITTAKLVEKTSDKFTVAQQVTEIASGELETDAISAKVTAPTFDSYSTTIGVQVQKTAQPQDSISESIKEESKSVGHTTATIKETMTPLVEIIEANWNDSKLDEIKDIMTTAKSLEFSPTTSKVVEEIQDVTTMQLVTPVHQPDKFQSTTSKHIDEGINVPTTSKPIAVELLTVVSLPVSADESVDETGSGTEMPLVESEIRTLKPLPIPSVELVGTVDSTTAAIVEDQTPNDIAHFVTTLPTEVPVVVEASSKSKISDELPKEHVTEMGSGEVETDSTKEHPKDSKSIKYNTMSLKATTPISETVSHTEKPLELQPTTPRHVEGIDTEIQPVTIEQPGDVQTAKLVEESIAGMTSSQSRTHENVEKSVTGMRPEVHIAVEATTTKLTVSDKVAIDKIRPGTEVPLLESEDVLTTIDKSIDEGNNVLSSTSSAVHSTPPATTMQPDIETSPTSLLVSEKISVVEIVKVGSGLEEPLQFETSSPLPESYIFTTIRMNEDLYQGDVQTPSQDLRKSDVTTLPVDTSRHSKVTEEILIHKLGESSSSLTKSETSPPGVIGGIKTPTLKSILLKHVTAMLTVKPTESESSQYETKSESSGHHIITPEPGESLDGTIRVTNIPTKTKSTNTEGVEIATNPTISAFEAKMSKLGSLTTAIRNLNLMVTEEESTTAVEGCFDKCSMLYEPVCGTDDHTYPNQCTLDGMACQFPGYKLDIQYTGPCIDYPDHHPRDLTTGSGMGSLIVEIIDLTDCHRICKDIKPVCGSDHATYLSECALKKYACMDDKNDLTKLYDGECIHELTRLVDGEGRCDQVLCPGIYSPVCANDGTTFANDCDLIFAKFCLGMEDIKKVYHGTC